jgi:hypothetical protein
MLFQIRDILLRIRIVSQTNGSGFESIPGSGTEILLF